MRKIPKKISRDDQMVIKQNGVSVECRFEKQCHKPATRNGMMIQLWAAIVRHSHAMFIIIRPWTKVVLEQSVHGEPVMKMMKTL